MQMTHVIINFRRHLKRRNYSPHTVKYYLNIIKQYVIWLDVPLEQATSEKIDALYRSSSPKTDASCEHQLVFGHHTGVLRLFEIRRKG